MPSILRAIAKAVSKVAGPLGAPIEGAISLMDDERSEKRNRELLEAITNGKDSVSELRLIVEEFFNDNNLVLKQIMVAIEAITREARKDHDFGCLLNATTEASSEEAVVKLLIPRLECRIPEMKQEGLITTDAVLDDLVEAYDDYRELWDIVVDAGFSRGRLPDRDNNRARYRAFLLKLKGPICTREIRSSVAHALAANADASEVLKTWAALYDYE